MKRELKVHGRHYKSGNAGTTTLTAKGVEAAALRLFNICLNEDEITALQIPDKYNFHWEACLAWLKAFVDVEAEPMPNRKGIRHIQKGGLTKEKIWRKYRDDMTARCDGTKVRQHKHRRICNIKAY